MTNRPEGRIQLTGLTPAQKNIIRDAAHYTRRSIKDYVVSQATKTMTEAQSVIDQVVAEAVRSANRGALSPQEISMRPDVQSGCGTCQDKWMVRCDWCPSRTGHTPAIEDESGCVLHDTEAAAQETADRHAVWHQARGH